MNVELETKLSRDALKLPNAYIEPASDLESNLTSVFSDVLNVGEVGAEDEFFDLGGDSLAAEQISMELLRVTGFEFPISKLIEFGSPRKIAQFLENDTAAKDYSKPPIFFVHGEKGYILPTASFLQGFHPDQKLVFLELPGIRGEAKALGRIEQIASRYVEKIIDECADDPVYIVSLCIGGMIALELVRQLAKLDRPAELVVLLDPGFPKGILRNYYEQAEPRSRSSAWRKQDDDIFEEEGMISTNFSPRSIFGNMLNHIRVARMAIRTVWQANVAPSGEAEKAGYKLLPQLKLKAAMNYYRNTDPYPGQVVIIASNAKKKKTYENPNGFWKSIFPNMQVQLIEGGHMEIAGANTERVSREVQRIFDTNTH